MPGWLCFYLFLVLFYFFSPLLLSFPGSPFPGGYPEDSQVAWTVSYSLAGACPAGSGCSKVVLAYPPGAAGTPPQEGGALRSRAVEPLLSVSSQKQIVESASQGTSCLQPSQHGPQNLKPYATVRGGSQAGHSVVS